LALLRRIDVMLPKTFSATILFLAAMIWTIWAQAAEPITVLAGGVNLSSTTTAPASTALRSRNTVVPVGVVPQYFPDVTKEAGTGPNETSVGKPIASRSAVFASADGRKKVTLSVDQYGSASDAAAAYQMAVQGSIAAPGFESARSPSLGQEALGTRDGRLIMSATHAGDILVATS
jgi:hypothetical protein